MKTQSVALFVLCASATLFAQQNPPPFTLQSAIQSAVDAPPSEAPATSSSPTPSPVLHDSQKRIVVQSDATTTYGMRYEAAYGNFAELVDEFGNRTRVTKTSSGLPIELKHEFMQRRVWFERFASDARGGLLMSSVDEGESTLGTKAAQFGIQVGFPDWIQVRFRQVSTINEIRVVTLQDNYQQGIKPLLASEAGGPTQFSLYGLTDYEVQYQDASGNWSMIPEGYITHNSDVARALVFAPIKTPAIRVIAKGGGGGLSRVVELEAFEPQPPPSGKTGLAVPRRNFALASQGATALASSTSHDPGFGLGGAIDGDETGRSWGNNGGWKDDTADVAPVPGTVTLQDNGTGYPITTFSNQFAQVHRTTNTNAKPDRVPLHQSVLLDRTDVTYAGGWHSFSASANMTANGIEYWDNVGGSRIQFYDANKRLFYVTDWVDGYETRPVVRINRDAQGRPTDVYLGSNVGVLQFTYDASGWAYTRLLNQANNNTMAFLIGRRDALGVGATTPISYPQLAGLTTGYMPQYGAIVEWHDSISPVPNIVCSLDGMPYALLRNVTTGYASGEVARYVIYPFSGEQEPHLNIRIEYDADTIYLYVPSLNSGQMVLQQDMRIFRFPRSGGNAQVSLHNERGPETAQIPVTRDRLLQEFLLNDWSYSKSKKRNVFSGRAVGMGGSGGAQCSDCEISLVDNMDVTAVGYGIIFPTYAGSNNPFPRMAPDPRAPAPRPSEPPNVNNPPPKNPCNMGEPRETTGSATNPGGCPAIPSSYQPPTGCVQITPNSLLEQQIEWARERATRAMQDPKCSAFLHDPSSGGYLRRAGYTGNSARLGVFGNETFDAVWRGMFFLDGTDPSGKVCPNQINGCGNVAWTYPNSPAVFVCPTWFNYYASDKGGVILQLTLMHEFLHVLGLCENGLCPSSTQIDTALTEACHDAAVSAGGDDYPPH